MVQHKGYGYEPKTRRQVDRGGSLRFRPQRLAAEPSGLRVRCHGSSVSFGRMTVRLIVGMVFGFLVTVAGAYMHDSGAGTASERLVDL